MSYFDYERAIFRYMDGIRSNVLVKPLNLGGVAGYSGGAGAPPGGFVGVLPQTRVAYDYTELSSAFTPSGLASGYPTLVDNLNHIRYRLDGLEASGIGGGGSRLTVEDTGSIIASGVTILDFVGFTVTPISLGARITAVTSPDEKVKATNSDPTAGYLFNKLTSGYGISITTDNSTVTITNTIPVVYTFIGLNDAPHSYTGKANQLVYVLAGENGLGFKSVQEGHIIKDRGTTKTTKSGLDFEGRGFSISEDASNTIITISGAHIIKDNSVTYLQRDNLKFTGNLVTITDDGAGNSTSILISGTKGHQILDSLTTYPQRNKLKFMGSGVSISDDGGNDTTIITISGTTSSQGGGHVIQDEGVSKTQRTKLNFVGDSVTVVDNVGNDSSDVIITVSGGGGSAKGDVSFYMDGVLVSGVCMEKSLIITSSGTIFKVYSYLENTGSAGNTIVDINKNGSTIFTTQANRPTIAYNNAQKKTSAVPDITSVVENDIVTVDIDSVATGAASLTVVLSMGALPYTQNVYNTYTTLSGGHTIQDEGISLSSRTKLNFVGDGVLASDDAGNDATKVTISGMHKIQTEGTTLLGRVYLNFVGSGVSVSDDPSNNRTIVTISGGGTSSNGSVDILAVQVFS